MGHLSTVSGMSNNPINVDNYNSDDQGSITSETSNLPTILANRRRIAINSVKLDSHIMLTPQEKISKPNVSLKNNLEFILYFRML